MNLWLDRMWYLPMVALPTQVVSKRRLPARPLQTEQVKAFS
jgi:hypothetical protein